MFEPIRTKRLLIRPVRPSDAGPLAERRSQPEVAEFQAWDLPYPAERAAALIESALETGGPKDDEWWMLTIADSDDAEVLGDLALHPTWGGRAVEIGYTLANQHHGRGYASEAVAGLVERLFDDPAVTRLSAMLHPDNHPSAVVLERNGFEYEGRTRLSYWVGDDNSDDLLYGLTREMWAAWNERPAHPPEVVELVEITPGNARDVRTLVTQPSQRRFVAPVINSFADAMFPEIVDGAPVVPWLRAVAADDELVGFVMMALTTEQHPEPYLWRFLIDRRHQRRGIGRRAVDLVVDQCREWGDATLAVSWCEGRGGPQPFYERYGFVPTGNIVDGETEARLTIR